MPKIEVAKAKRERADRRGRTIALGGRAFLGIDPGDKHVGFAWFEEGNDGLPGCAYAVELTPDECADRVAGALFRDELWGIGIERFTLYGDKAQEQVGSEMLTSQLIGVVNYLVRVHNRDATTTEGPWAAQRVRLVSEGAHAKKAIRAQLKARGIDRIGKIGDHTGDAEEQGWYWLYRLAEEEWSET